jgi:hypothetical protein
MRVEGLGHLFRPRKLRTKSQSPEEGFLLGTAVVVFDEGEVHAKLSIDGRLVGFEEMLEYNPVQLAGAQGVPVRGCVGNHSGAS